MLLECIGLSKKYREVQALDDFSASFQPGIHALLGPNGSGKTTLMNLITRNLKADSGCIRWNGTEAVSMGSEFLSIIGYMPQTPGLYPNLTIEEFLRYMASVKDLYPGMKGRERKEAISGAIDRVLEAVDLSDCKRRKIDTLSGGMKQRAALAQAILGEPELLLLDEPTAGLDPKQRIEIRNLLSRLSLNRIILLSTHQVQDISGIAQNVYLMNKGRIIMSGGVKDLCAQLKGKIWEESIMESDLPNFETQVSVIQILPLEKEDCLRVRYLAETPASNLSRTIDPTLEDLYFFAQGNSNDNNS